MTCIVGIKSEDGKVRLGSDSFAGNLHVRYEVDYKIIRKGSRVGIGCCGSLRLPQILKNNFNLKCPKKVEDSNVWMNKQFIPAMLKALDEARFTDNDWEILIAAYGKLYTMQPDLSIIELDWHAVGTGSLYAVGAMAVMTAQPEMSEDHLLLSALTIAEEYCPTVSSPFYVEEF